MTRNSKQLALPFLASHGGRRVGAGRSNRSGMQGHGRRPRLNVKVPVHLTLRLAQGLPSLRRKDVFLCLRKAVKTARIRGFSVVHYAIFSNHMHFILEPKEENLGRVIQSLTISFSKRLNSALGRTGSVFRDRYHVRALQTPTEVRRAVEYVLTNEFRHRRESKRQSPVEIRIDPFSSALSFRNWKYLIKNPIEFSFSLWSENVIESWHQEVLRPPKTWLLRKGWIRGKT